MSTQRNGLEDEDLISLDRSHQERKDTDKENTTRKVKWSFSSVTPEAGASRARRGNLSPLKQEGFRFGRLDDTRQHPIPLAHPTAFPEVPFVVPESTIWDVYNNEARSVDNELVKDWTSNLNFLLVFAAIFAAVLTAFIIESKGLLEQDPTDVMVDILIFYTNNLANGTHAPYKPKPFVPTNSAVSINCFFFASLSASIVAALSSVIALQWVGEYDAVTSRAGASPQDRAKRRQFWFAGMKRWKMGEIIAIIPVLLYSSVILFFIGLIQWMLGIQSTVGYIVMGGAAIATLFWLVSVSHSVVVPSSPFRTPTSRWIYASLHFLFQMLLSFSRFMQFKGVTRFMETTSMTKPTIQTRNDSYVRGDSTLIPAALSWLATHISLSSDSYRRLRLLIQEVVSLDPRQQLGKAFREAPWWEIFDVLGSRQLDRALVKQPDEEDMMELNLILQCLRSPRLGSLVAPGKWHEHDSTRDKGSTSRSHNSAQTESYNRDSRQLDAINASYFLLQNLSVPEDLITTEVQLRHRLAYMQQVQDTEKPTLQVDEDWRRIVKRCESEQLGFADAMVQLADKLFEIPSIAREEHTNWFLLSLRIGRPVVNQPISFALPSGPFQLMPTSPVMMRLRCRSVNWIKILVKYPDMDLKRVLFSLSHSQMRTLAPLWRFVATDEEVTYTLESLDTADRNSVLELITSARRDYRLVEAFEAFDHLLEARKEILDEVFELILEDLKFPTSSMYEDYYTDTRKEALSQMRHPLLRVMSYAIAGIEWNPTWSQELDNYRGSNVWDEIGRYCLKEHHSHSSMIWNLRTQLWSHLPHDRTKSIITDALRDLAPTGLTLSCLETGFEQPSLGLEQGGDQLLVIIHLTMARTEEYLTRGIHSMDLSSDESLWSIWSGAKIFEISEVSETHLSQLCRSIEGSQTRLVRVLREILKIELEARVWWQTIRVLRKVCAITRRCLLTKKTEASISSHEELASIITRLRDTLLSDDSIVLRQEEREKFNSQCTSVIAGLRPQHI